jgi:hypothetical protein
MSRYIVKVGLDYTGPDGTERRAEPNEVVDDLPAEAIDWLLASGLIEPEPASDAKEVRRRAVRPR